MATTFQKRQKEMKRIERPKIKEEKRAQRKTEKDDDPKSTSLAERVQTKRNPRV